MFSNQEQAPTAVPFHYSDNKAIVVLDRDGEDDNALRLAYMWARWVVRRTLAGTDEAEFDLARISRLIEDAQRSIDRATTIRRYHSTAIRQIELAGGELDSLAEETDRALEQIREALAAE